MTNQNIQAYHDKLADSDKQICDALRGSFNANIPKAESKVWHGHPVWFLDGNPIVGYSKQKAGVRLMFWSGRSFDEPELTGTSRFQDASVFYNSADEIDEQKLERWLQKATTIQWDYKNIVKNRGVLHRKP